MSLQNRLDVRSEYYLFENAEQQDYDIVLLLNVLHHVGDDYGDSKMSIDKAREQIIESLRTMAQCTQNLVLQLGFNWQGDTTLPLFEHGTKKEMLDFLQDRLADVYSFDRILVGEAVNGRVSYNELDDRNIERRDDLGEFLNRPLLFLSVKI